MANVVLKKKDDPIDLPESSIEIPSFTLPNGEIIHQGDVLQYGDFLYDIGLYDDKMRVLDTQTVYLYGDYFYPYRGKWNDAIANTTPGFYFDDVHDQLIRIDPETEEEKKTYDYHGKIQRVDFLTIRDVLNKGEQTICNMPESSKLNITPLKASDDILKRLVKMAIMDKGIDIDQYRARFIDKNALLFFMQVIKGDNRLSMLLFDRGTTALNLKYTIILEEKDPEHPIGKALTRKLVCTSEDTYSMTEGEKIHDQLTIA